MNEGGGDHPPLTKRLVRAPYVSQTGSERNCLRSSVAFSSANFVALVDGLRRQHSRSIGLLLKLGISMELQCLRDLRSGLHLS